PLLKARYTMPVVPIANVAVGVLIARMLAETTQHRWLTVSRLCGAGLWLALATGFFWYLCTFEASMIARGCTNAPQRAPLEATEGRPRRRHWALPRDSERRDAPGAPARCRLRANRLRVGVDVCSACRLHRHDFAVIINCA